VHEQLSTSRAPFERVTWPTQQPSLPTATHPCNSLKTCPGLPTTCESCTRAHCGPHASTHRRCNRPTSTHNPGSALPSDQCSPTTSQHATSPQRYCNRPWSACNPVGTVGPHTTNVRPQLVSTQPAHRGNATARSQHTTLECVATQPILIYNQSARNPPSRILLPPVVSTQPTR